MDTMIDATGMDFTKEV